MLCFSGCLHNLTSELHIYPLYPHTVNRGYVYIFRKDPPPLYPLRAHSHSPYPLFPSNTPSKHSPNIAFSSISKITRNGQKYRNKSSNTQRIGLITNLYVLGRFWVEYAAKYSATNSKKNSIKILSCGRFSAKINTQNTEHYNVVAKIKLLILSLATKRKTKIKTIKYMLWQKI